MRTRGALPLLAVLACGELKAGTDGPGADASADAGSSVDGGPLDAAVDSPASPGDAGVADAGRGRLVFVTSAQVTGAFALGKPDPWAAADAVCATEATANSLTGEFVAWLSYMSNGTAFNALGRIADAPYYLPGNLVDGGAPVLVATSRADLLANGPRVPLDRLATGLQAPQDENSAVTWVWTGTKPDGTASSGCADWTSAAANTAGTTGNARRIPQYTASDWTSLGNRPCDLPRRFYCFQK